MNLSEATPKERNAEMVRVLGRPGDTLRVEGKIVRINETHLRQDGVWFVVRFPDYSVRMIHSSVLEDPSVQSIPMEYGKGFGFCGSCAIVDAVKSALVSQQTNPHVCIKPPMVDIVYGEPTVKVSVVKKGNKTKPARTKKTAKAKR